MKEIVSAPIGGDGGKASVVIEKGMVVAKVEYPVVKVLEPVVSAANSAIDKLEELIPGDQKAAAQLIKAKFKEELDKAVAEI